MNSHPPLCMQLKSTLKLLKGTSFRFDRGTSIIDYPIYILTTSVAQQAANRLKLPRSVFDSRGRIQCLHDLQIIVLGLEILCYHLGIHQFLWLIILYRESMCRAFTSIFYLSIWIILNCIINTMIFVNVFKKSRKTLADKVWHWLINKIISCSTI